MHLYSTQFKPVNSFVLKVAAMTFIVVDSGAPCGQKWYTHTLYLDVATVLISCLIQPGYVEV